MSPKRLSRLTRVYSLVHKQAKQDLAQAKAAEKDAEAALENVLAQSTAVTLPMLLLAEDTASRLRQAAADAAKRAEQLAPAEQATRQQHKQMEALLQREQERAKASQRASEQRNLDDWAGRQREDKK